MPTLPPNTTTISNNNQTNLSQQIIINGPAPVAPTDLIYDLTTSNPLFPLIMPDFVNPVNAYHGGYTKIDPNAVIFFDCNNLTLTNTTKEVVSDFRNKGIMELRTSNGNYYWDEVYTTPLGLYLYKNSPISLGDLYKFELTAANKIKLHTEDPNIIPKIDDYLVVQRFFDTNSFTNESTTDELNNVLVYSKSETFQFKIINVVPTTGSVTPISNVTLTGTNPNQIVITTTINHNLTTGDKVNINGVIGIPLANGTFTVNVLSLTTFELLGLDGTTPIIGSGTYGGGGRVTALPLYEIELDKSFNPIGANGGSFSVSSGTTATPIVITTTTSHNFSTGNKVDISGVIGLVGANGTFYVIVTSSTTLELYSDAQLTNPVVGTGAYISGGLVIESPAKYIFALLNRKGTTLNKELFVDTWRETEIHRQQLIGDPFNETSILKFTGAKNYLNYGSSGYLGMQHQLTGVIENRKTPFILFDIQDDIKDRLYSADGAFELHLPTVMLQGEAGRVILKNKGPVSIDNTGDGQYSGLYFVDATNANTRTIRFGWVMHELRVAIIDHPELATALGYNSNRNYTLPDPTLKTANTVQNPTNSDPIIISNVTATTPNVVTTTTNHGLKTGDKVQISGVQPQTLLPDGIYYVNNPTANQIELYLDPTLTVPTVGISSYSGGGSLVSFKLPYEYFITYRLNGKHYSTAPYADPLNFNFDVNDEVKLEIPQLSNLVDGTNFEGYEANTFEIIVGKYKQNAQNPTEIIGTEYITLAPAINHKFNSINHSLASGTVERRRLPLKDASGNQTDVTGHLVTISRADLEDVNKNWLVNTVVPISPAVGPPDETKNILYDLVTTGLNTPYYIYNNVYSQPLYYDQVVLVPNSTLFAADGIWTIGFAKYKQQAQQYRLTMRMPIAAGKWNGSTNPSYEPGNSLMKNKLITEVEFLIDDPNGDPNDPNSVIQAPYVYGKISPALEKNNQTDLSVEISIDF